MTVYQGGYLAVEKPEIINAVTKEQLVDAAKKLTLDTVFVLKNK